MYFTKSLLVAAVLSAAGVQATHCPDIWSTVARKLKDVFGECNSNARQAIRLPFHDCFAGACDGSIILSDECTDRSENAQLIPICGTLGNIADQYNVGVADLIQVAAAVAVVTCPPSPTIRIKIGRKDSSQANPENQIPPPTLNAEQLVDVFQRKGFSRDELVALVGSHSAGVNRSGTSFDTTVTRLDSPTFYTQTVKGTAPSTLFSDRSLATDQNTRGQWQEYAGSQDLWNNDFSIAMQKMAVMGVDSNDLQDCTSTIFGFDSDGFW